MWPVLANDVLHLSIMKTPKQTQHAYFRLSSDTVSTKITRLSSLVYPSTHLPAMILAETVLAEASATLTAGQDFEGLKTLSTQKVATAQTLTYSKVNSNDRVSVLTARNTMKAGGHAGHRLARTWPLFLQRVHKSFGKIEGHHRGVLWQRPERAHGHAHFHKLHVLLDGKGGLRSARQRPRVRSEEERVELHRGWQRRRRTST